MGSHPTLEASTRGTIGTSHLRILARSCPLAGCQTRYSRPTVPPSALQGSHPHLPHPQLLPLVIHRLLPRTRATSHNSVLTSFVDGWESTGLFVLCHPPFREPCPGCRRVGGFQFIRPGLPLQGSSLQHTLPIVRSWGCRLLILPGVLGSVRLPLKELPPGQGWNGKMIEERRRVFTPSRVGVISHVLLPRLARLLAHPTFPSMQENLTVLGGADSNRSGTAWCGCVAWDSTARHGGEQHEGDAVGPTRS